MKRILVAYTSKTGTTKETAMLIKDTLEKAEYAVDVLTLEQAGELSSYNGVIVGAPINGFKWVPEAVQFVERNETVLKTVPTAFFAMNYIGETGRAGIKGTLLKNFDSLKTRIEPLSIQLFGGRIDKELPGFARLLFGVKKGSPIDVTKPEQVVEWAEMLKTKF